MKTWLRVLACASVALSAACGGDDDDVAGDVDAGRTCDLDLTFEEGDNGHADPLGAGPGEVRAGIAVAGDLPQHEAGLLTWEPGDFILANDKFALVIEGVGPSDLYDPWGGRPVGMGLVEDGAIAAPSNFGEFFILTGRETVVTTSVTVLNDGSNGEAAVIRAHGTPAPLPFWENIVGGLWRETHPDMPTAIDYVLEPGAEYVDIFVTHLSPRSVADENPSRLHAFMYEKRMPLFGPKIGFDTESADLAFLAFVDDDAASYSYERLDGTIDPGVSASGFTGKFGGGFTIEPCAETRRHYARIAIGGPGLDGLLQTRARIDGETQHEIAGTVTDSQGNPAAGVRVHATSADLGYLTRVTTDETGAYALHVPDGEDVELTAFRRGDDPVGPIAVAAAEGTADIALPAAGFVHVTAVDAISGDPLPVRMQVLPTTQSLPSFPSSFGEDGVTGGRLHVEFDMDGDHTFRVPAGDWEIVVSRGWEYELTREVVTVTDGGTAELAASLERVVDTVGLQCADYHIHTHRSNDSGDDARMKVRGAVADGLELPIRSEHEYAANFKAEIAELGLEAFAFGTGSVEMSSMEIWGHMGVLPIEPDDSLVNGGTPLWQDFPSEQNPLALVETLAPPVVFERVRQRAEQPVIIINHPRGGQNYFDYAGYDPTTGEAQFPEYWDEEFRVVEVFNSSSWPTDLGGVVRDWLSFLNFGRRVFAVASSDSHGIMGSPVGYPRTCLEVGTDDPRELNDALIRDATANGHSTISGGIVVNASVGEAGPGDDATGLGATATVHVRVQAASWVDVDSIDVVVDGEVFARIDIQPEDANPENLVIRFEQDIEVPVSDGALGSYVVVAAYGNASLEPVLPGRRPFGVTNPIFLSR